MGEFDFAQAQDGSLRDRLWIWSCMEGSLNGGIWKVPGESHVTTVEAARHLGIPNAIFIQWQGRPQPPFVEYARPLGALKRLMWTAINNSGGRAALAESDHFFELAHAMPNLTGAFLDDFLIDAGGPAGGPEPQSAAATAGPDDEIPAALSVSELGQLQRRLHEFEPRRLELGVVLYMQQMRPEMMPHLRQCDIVSLWTSKAKDLVHLEENLARFERLAPGKRVFLGCYMYDFGEERPIPLDLMAAQCRAGRQWLEQGRIEGMIFCAANLCGRNLEAVEFTRRWIAELGGD